MSKVSKIFYKFQCFKCYVCQRFCLRLLCNTAYSLLVLISFMSKVLKMSNTIVLCIQWPLTPARREGYLFEPSILGV